MMKRFSGTHGAGRMLAGALLLALCGTALGQVNTEELQKGQGSVEFFNYEGPVTRIDTRAQIRGIGYTLGQAVSAGAGRSGAESRYFLIHGGSGPQGTRLDADIFGLGAAVGVDHIRNLRLIIQGYLEGAYHYSPQDAALLAQYITIYNAVYRGNWGYFRGAYIPEVLRFLTPDRAGLSLRFSEWPGKTLMVIPLGIGSAGSLSAIDTSSLSDAQVLEELRKEPDSGITQRKDLVELKEREADEAEQEALRQQQALAEEEARLAAARAALEAEQARLEQERSAAQGEPSAEAAERALVAQEEAARQREQALREEEAALAAQREQAARLEAFAEQKREEAQQDRQGIAQDQQGFFDSGVDVPGPERGEAAGEETPGEAEGQGPGAEAVQGEGAAGNVPGEDEAGPGTEEALEEGSVPEAAAEGGSAGSGEAEGNAEEEAGAQEEEVPELAFEAVEDAQVAGVVGMALAGGNSPLGSVVKINPASGAELKRTELNTIKIRTVVVVDEQILAVAGDGDTLNLVAIDPNTLEVVYQSEEAIHGESLLWVHGQDLYAILVAEGNCYLGRFDTALTLQARSEIPVHPYGMLLFHEDLISTQDAAGKAVILDIFDLLARR